jgi:hypothetical protein
LPFYSVPNSIPNKKAAYLSRKERGKIILISGIIDTLTKNWRSLFPFFKDTYRLENYKKTYF